MFSRLPLFSSITGVSALLGTLLLLHPALQVAEALSATKSRGFANVHPTPILQQIDPVTQTVLDGFHSIVEASSRTGTPASTIFRAIHGNEDAKSSTAGGYHWRWCLEATNPITRDMVAARREAEIYGSGIGKNPENRGVAAASPEFFLRKKEEGEAAFNAPSPSHEDKEAAISSIVHPEDGLVKILLSCLLGGGSLRSIVRWVIHRRSSASAASHSDV